jgi:hydrophobic/amphiphilic exporter-1 (mainly G- bacteria), HAE1 family
MLCRRIGFFSKNHPGPPGLRHRFHRRGLLIAWGLMPKAEYLPQGNQNIIMSILVPPPGYSESQAPGNRRLHFNQVKPYMEWTGKTASPDRHTFYVNADMFVFVGTTCTEANETRARELIPLMNRIINSIPDMFGVSIQPGIFQTDLGQGRTVDVNVSGDDLPAIIQSAGMLFGALSQAVPERPDPAGAFAGNDLSGSQYHPGQTQNGRFRAQRNRPGQLRGRDERRQNHRRIPAQGGYHVNLVVRAPENAYQTPEEILNAMIANNHGQLIRIGDVARIEYGQGMTQIARLEKRRNIRWRSLRRTTCPCRRRLKDIDGLIAGLSSRACLQGSRSPPAAMPTNSRKPSTPSSGISFWL